MYSKILISGRLVEPADDKPRSGVTLVLTSLKNSSVVLKHATYRCVTGGNGEYSFNAAPGTYAVAVSVYGAEPERVGQIRVYSDSLPGDLNTFLMAPAEDDLTPEIIRLVDRMRSEAVKAAESAKNSEKIVTQLAGEVAEHAKQVASDKVVVEQKTTMATDAAATAVAAKEQTSKDAVATRKDRQVTETKAQEASASADEAKSARDSIVNDAADVREKAKQVADNAVSVANNTEAVQRNTEQVAQNTQTVSTKAQQVSDNAQSVAAQTESVTQMRDDVAAKTAMAQGAADTAAQKAESAAEHEAAAAEYARLAQEAVQASTGTLIDGGAVDLSAGTYPKPVQVSGTARPTFWKVTKGGTVGDVDYGVGDTLIYTVAGDGSYYKVDNTESVTSVQGEKGTVTLTPEKIGAEPAGTSAETILQHEQKNGAHSISGVAGLEERLTSLEERPVVADISGHGFAERAPTLPERTDLLSEAVINVSRVWTLSGVYTQLPATLSGAAWGILEVFRCGDDRNGCILVLHLNNNSRQKGQTFKRVGCKPSDVWQWGEWVEVYDSGSFHPAISDIDGLEQRLQDLEQNVEQNGNSGYGYTEVAPQLEWETSLISDEATGVSRIWTLNGYYNDTPWGHCSIDGVLDVLRGGHDGATCVLKLSLVNVNAPPADEDRTKEYIRKGFKSWNGKFIWHDWIEAYNSSNKPEITDVVGLEEALAGKATLGYGFAEEAPHLSQSIDLTSEEVISVSRIWTLNAHHAGIPSELSTATGFLEVVRSTFDGHHTILFLHLTSSTNGFAYKSYKRIGERSFNGDYVWSDWIDTLDANYGSVGEIRSYSAERPELIEAGWRLIESEKGTANTSTSSRYTYEYQRVNGG